MAQAQSEIRYLTPPSVDIKKKNTAVSRKTVLSISITRSRIPEKILERTRQDPAPSYHRNFVEISTSYCTSCEKSPSLGAAPLCN